VAAITSAVTDHAAPAGELRKRRERRAGEHRAEVADEHAQTHQRGETPLVVPQGEELEHGDEGDRHAKAREGASGECHFQRRGEREEETSRGGDEPARYDDAPRPHGVGEDASGQLHQRVDVKIGGGERAERGGAGVEGRSELGGDASGGEAVEEGQNVGGDDDDERRRAAAVGHRESPLFVFGIAARGFSAGITPFRVHYSDREDKSWHPIMNS